LLAACPSRSETPPVFAAPWQAQAFALAVALADRGIFTPAEWAEALGAAELQTRRHGDPDDGTTYYRHWLAALETLVVAKGLTSPGMLTIMRDRWDIAARETPHGQPIALAPSGAADGRPEA
jgi:nitrile hydratase accessory protein